MPYTSRLLHDNFFIYLDKDKDNEPKKYLDKDNERKFYLDNCYLDKFCDKKFKKNFLQILMPKTFLLNFENKFHFKV